MTVYATSKWTASASRTDETSGGNAEMQLKPFIISCGAVVLSVFFAANNAQSVFESAYPVIRAGEDLIFVNGLDGIYEQTVAGDNPSGDADASKFVQITALSFKRYRIVIGNERSRDGLSVIGNSFYMRLLDMPARTVGKSGRLQGYVGCVTNDDKADWSGTATCRYWFLTKNRHGLAWSLLDLDGQANWENVVEAVAKVGWEIGREGSDTMLKGGLKVYQLNTSDLLLLFEDEEFGKALKPGKTLHLLTRLDSERMARASAHRHRGQAHMSGKNYRAAIKEFAAAVETYPAMPLLHLSKGSAFYENGQNPEALAEFEEAIRLDYRYQRAHMLKGLTLERMGKPNQALYALSEAQQFGPYDGEADYLYWLTAGRHRSGNPTSDRSLFFHARMACNSAAKQNQKYKDCLEKWNELTPNIPADESKPGTSQSEELYANFVANIIEMGLMLDPALLDEDPEN